MDQLRGFDITRAMLWMARPIPEHEEAWQGTGLEQPGIIIHTDIKAALTFFLMGYPQTDTIEAVIGNQYRMVMPANAAATTIINVILKELGVE